MRSPHLPLAFLTLLASVASATVIVHETLDELVRRVPVIVRARVVRSMTAWDEQKRTIWTWTELTVTDTLKGESRALVLIKHHGGEIDGIGQAVSGAVKFHEGEDCVLFLEPAPGEKAALMVSGMSAGKVLMTEVKGLPTAVRDTAGLAFARPAGKAVEQVLTTEFLGSPDAFIQRVRHAAGVAR